MFGIRDGHIAWARLYIEPVEQGGEDIATAVQQLYQPSMGNDATE